jgi:AraC family transcriptional regulator of adaptative response / DNA-3-methyladenine glycosylase II
VESRDRRFDGRFVVAITTTKVYCRPSCPSRQAHAHHRRFFDTAAYAEQFGYRPCRRCRPRAVSAAKADPVSHLANEAVKQIAEGALDGRSVHALASDLGVSARHLRRCLQHELGASPLELALTHRLLLAQRLLVETRQSVSRVAYTSGFQSLRRFNAAFRERFETTPGAWRREPSARDGVPEALTLSLRYSAPFAWEPLLLRLREDAVPGVVLAAGREYGSTVRLEGHVGHFLARHDPRAQVIEVDVSASLAPVLVPLVARLRRVFDLDAQPEVIDGHLEASGLGHLTRRRPGIRLPGAVDGFRVATVAFMSRGGADREGARARRTARSRPRWTREDRDPGTGVADSGRGEHPRGRGARPERARRPCGRGAGSRIAEPTARRG